MALPEQVRIREVGPRDGFQNEPEVVPTEDKVRLVDMLATSGIKRLEVTSFVRADVVPQLADGARVLERQDLKKRIAAKIRSDCSPRHVPNEVMAIAEVPRTLSGKPLEVPVKRILMGTPPDQVASRDSLANPAALDWFVDFAAARGASGVARVFASSTALAPARVKAGYSQVRRSTIVGVSAAS